jgi:hypothetical protein
MMFDLLQKLVCVSLDIHIWSGQKKLQAADLNLTAGEIPPEKLASLGIKKICNPSLLKPFQALRRRAERICEAAGVRFLGGFAVPEDKAEAVGAELDKVAAEFEAEKSAFLKNYQQSVSDWMDTIPDRWRKMVAQAIESPEYVANRISFAFQTYQVQGVEGLNTGLEQTVQGLGGQLFQEIAQAAKQSWEASFRGKTQVSQKALRPIRAILEKAKGLSFLDVSLVPVIAGIETELAGLPKSGYLEGRDFHTLVGILNTLTNLDGITLPGEADLDEQEAQDETEISDNEIEATAQVAAQPVTMPATWF